MNANPNANTRAALERLMQEFASAASDNAPVFHERLSGLANQQLTKQTWEQFRLANYLRLNQTLRSEWQVWVPHPDGAACSFFHSKGDKSALDNFRRLAETGLAILKMAAINPDPACHFDAAIAELIDSQQSESGVVKWLDVVHLTAKQCRTIFLHATIGNWAYSTKPGESIEQVASAMSEPTTFGLDAVPLHPITESLQHDVFRSSSEAIKVWLGMDDVVRLGDWPERPPIHLLSVDRAAVAEITAAPPTPKHQSLLNEMEENILTALGDKSMTAEMLSQKAGYPNNSNFRKTCGNLVRRGLLGNVRGKGYFRIDVHR